MVKNKSEFELLVRVNVEFNTKNTSVIRLKSYNFNLILVNLRETDNTFLYTKTYRMRLFYKNCVNSLLFTLSLTASYGQITYVNQNAAGANDGTTWADAFTDLQDALNAAQEGQIWIAAGTYLPSTIELDTFNTFFVDRELSIYGGFAGTETTLEDRIQGANTTILSGDMMGDDLDNNFDMNKSDNVFHVLTLAAPATSIIVIDALTIKGGNTPSDNEGASDYEWSGGGIYSSNTVEISDCNFDNNFARSGASIFITPAAGGGNNSKIENCMFEKNRSASQSAGIFMNQIDGATISGCTFQSNTTTRGALYPLRSTNVLIENCNFLNNIPTTSTNFGGAVFVWNTTGTIRGCNFVNNTSGNGGVMYIDGRELIDNPSADNVVIDNCNFSGNTAQDFGGGCIYSSQGSYTVMNSQFLNNNGDNGGAIFSTGDGQNIVSMGNTFQGNTANFGGSHANYGEFSNYTMRNNEYIGNAANTSGGATINGFGASVLVDNCQFNSNIAGFGGAMFCQNDTTNIEVYNSSFKENSVADGNGGAINLSGPIMLTVDNCNFESNIAGFGGAINGSQGNDVDIIEGFVNISNSTITLNTVSGQGAGISLVDLDLNMVSTVLGTNFNTGVGSGGGVSINTTANKSSTFNITNCTLVDNFAIIGSGISAFTEDATSECIINLQNNIFSNEGLNYEIEDGTPVVNSLGGNISTDATLEGILTGPGDINESEDILFVDKSNGDFQLQNDSPAINIGVAEGAPETDIIGNPRVDAPDAGAYENQDPLSFEVIENAGQMSLAPNPADTYTRISLSNDWTGLINIVVLETTGKVAHQIITLKTSKDFIYDLPLDRLSTGSYILTVQSNNQKIATPFIKI